MVITSKTQVVRPIDEYMYSMEQSVAVATTYQDYVNQCYSAHGIPPEFKLSTTSEELAPFTQMGVENRVTRTDMWGFFDTVTVDQFGYDYPDSSSGGLEGSDPSGYDYRVMVACAQAVDLITPGNWAFSEDFTHLPDGGPAPANSDSRYVPLLKQWHDCMASKGFDYSTPLDAMLDNEWRENESLRPEMMARARTDIDCKISTNFVGEVLAIQIAYDNVYIDAHRDALQNEKNKLQVFLSGKAEVPPINPETNG
jgi:hypothetical protein